MSGHELAAWLVTGAIGAGALAQEAAPKPKDPEPAPTAQSATGWPEPVKKELYAKDFRGKTAPEVIVEEMLTPKPDREGKVLLIDFWATWCGPCRKAIPELNELQKTFKDDLVVMGISDEAPAVVREFMKSTEMAYAQATDTKKRMSTEVGVKGIPHVLVISTDGIVRWQGFPLSTEEPLTKKIVRQIIENDPGVKARREANAKKGQG
jgi:cytochrome c biogenesis protein CcmG/thiol:disulfide interchange protein DsbE